MIAAHVLKRHTQCPISTRPSFSQFVLWPYYSRVFCCATVHFVFEQLTYTTSTLISSLLKSYTPQHHKMQTLEHTPGQHIHTNTRAHMHAHTAMQHFTGKKNTWQTFKKMLLVHLNVPVLMHDFWPVRVCVWAHVHVCVHISTGEFVHQNCEWRKISAKESTAWSRLSVYTVSAPLGLEGSFCILDEFTEV